MIAVLKQKKGLNYRNHTLYEDRILVETRSVRKIDKYEIKIDKLGFQTQYQADNTFYGKIFLAICLVVPLGLLISELTLHNIGTRTLLINCGCFLFLALMNVLKEHQDDVYIVGGEKTLTFYRNIPSEQKVLEFIELVNKTSKNFITNKYLSFDPSTSDEEYLARLNWLKETEIISEEEYEEFKIDFEIKRLLS